MTPRHPSVPNLIWDKGNLDRWKIRRKAGTQGTLSNPPHLNAAGSRVAPRCSFAGKQAVVGNDGVVSEHDTSRNHCIAADATISPDNATHEPGVLSNGNAWP